MSYKTLIPFEFGIIIYFKLQVIISCIRYVKHTFDKLLEIIFFIVLIGVHFRYTPGKIEVLFNDLINGK